MTLRGWAPEGGLCDPLFVASSPNRFAERLFAPLPRRYDRLAAGLSFGQNARWRSEMVARAVAGSPGRVLDVATGPAGVAVEVTERSAARVVGVDITASMLEQARVVVARHRLGDRIGLARASAEELPFADGAFDAVTSAYLLRYVGEPAAVLAELARVLRPGGVLATLDFAVPPTPASRAAWWCYTRVGLPLAGAVAGGRPWFDVGRFLGPSITEHDRRFPLEWTVRAWEDAGMVDVGWRRMSLGGGLVMWGRRVGG